MVDPTKVQHLNWNQVRLEQLNAKISRRMVWGVNEMLAYIFIKKGGVVPEHSHVSEQISHILEGTLKFLIEGRGYIVEQGQVLIIPPNVPHSAEALQDVVDLDIFSPIRTDWIEGTDAYLRR